MREDEEKRKVKGEKMQKIREKGGVGKYEKIGNVKQKNKRRGENVEGKRKVKKWRKKKNAGRRKKVERVKTCETRDVE